MSASFAQEAAPEMQKIEVTGSRIPIASTEGTSPVLTLGSKDIKADGVRDVESLLNNLPQVFASQSSSSVLSAGSGTATVDLRGLGDNRTLVLVNGHRLPQGSPGSVAADLNQIPASLIKRVEVLSGGAGAVYGADAVAGVVNFIMNDRFEGVQIELNGSGYNHKQQNTAGVADLTNQRAATNPQQFQVPGDINSLDARSKDVSLLMGANFNDNKGNATLFFSYKKDDAVLQAARDFSACGVSASAAGFACGGSGISATGRFINTTTGKVYTVTDPAGTARIYNNATDLYNFAPSNYRRRPDERYGVAASMHYKVSDQARVYGDFAFHDDKTDAQIAPGGVFGGLYTIGFDNPLLSPSWRTALGLVKPGDTTGVAISRRNVEGGGRDDAHSNTSFRSLFGVKGELGKWHYDVFAQTSKVRYQSSAKNYFSSARINRALDAVNQGGKAVCRSVVDGSDANCVPYNPWVAGGVTPAQLAYLQVMGIQTGNTQQQIQGANIASDLGNYGLKMPMAKNGVGVSFGVERRKESLELAPDAALQSGDLSGRGGPVPAQKGQYVVKDYFGEVRVPLLEDRPFAELLAVNGSFRHSDIDTGVKANTYGLGIEWAPISQVRLRASTQKAVRAPNILELFSPASDSTFAMAADPCAGARPSATAAQCAHTGVTAAQYGNILVNTGSEWGYLAGGNLSLEPETSKSKTFGVVLTPLKNLAVTIDYFDIKVDDTISIVSPVTTLKKCLDSGDAQFCSKITRDSLGTLWLLDAQIVATNQNIGSLATSGIDLGVNYGFKLDHMGRVGLALNGSYLEKFEVEEIPGDGAYDCVGLYNGAGKCGQPRPQWRHKARASWNTPWAVDLAVTWRYFQGVKLETTSDNPLLKGIAFPAESSFGSANYIDLSAAYNITKQIAISGGINNVFDRDPPITSKYLKGGGGNTFPSMYDALGRKFSLNLTAKF